MTNKSRFAIVLISALMLAVGVAVYRMGSGRPEVRGAPQVRAARADDSRLNDFEQQLSSLQTDIAKLRRGRSHEVEPPAGTPLPAESASSVLDGMSPAERDGLLTRTAVQVYDATIDTESRDDSWASEQEGTVAHVVAALGTSTLDEVACRSSMCRTIVAHDSEDAREDFRSTFGRAPFNTQCFATPTATGIGTIIFCAREGHDLATIDLEKAAMLR